MIQYDSYKGKRVKRKTISDVVDILLDPYTAILGLLVIIGLLIALTWINGVYISTLNARLKEYENPTEPEEKIVLFDSKEAYRDKTHTIQVVPVKMIFEKEEPIIEEVIEEIVEPIKEEVKTTVKPTSSNSTKIYILQVLTHEAGTDAELCKAVTQCLYNACAKYNWQYSPAEMIRKYKYTTPYDWYSNEAQYAYEMIFERGETYALVGNALYFYAPKYCSSEWHESMRFVVEIHSIRFFGDW